MRLLVLGSRPELEGSVRASWLGCAQALFFAADPIAALQHAVEDAPDLILIDLGWPEPVRVGFCTGLAREAATASIPVASIERAELRDAVCADRQDEILAAAAMPSMIAPGAGRSPSVGVR